MNDVRLIRGDCLKVLPTLEPGSVDAVVTDPPYGLEFMGKEWDRLDDGLPQEKVWKGRRGNGGSKIGSDDSKPASRHHVAYGVKRGGFNRCATCGKRQFSGSPCQCDDPKWVTEYAQAAPSAAIRMQRWHERWARAVYPVLRPGGYLLAFGGTRTFHRLACAIEDAGFELRDTLCWLYGQGFPKGKGCLKPAWEPILLARKPGPRVLPLPGLDACRVRCEERPRREADRGRITGNAWDGGPDGSLCGSKANGTTSEGRWPANVILDEEAGALLDGQAGPQKSGGTPRARKAAKTLNAYGDFNGEENPDGIGGSAGAVSRFFYCAKASRRDRESGLDCLEVISLELHTGGVQWGNEVRRARLLVDTAPSLPRVIGGSEMLGVDVSEWNTFLFGSSTTTPPLKGWKFTTSTRTSSTTESRTLNWLLRLLTSVSIPAANSAPASGGSLAESAEKCSPSLSIIAVKTASLPGVGRVPSETRLTISGNAGSPANHPTVKPTALMRWLCRLVTPPGGTVLDPFLGSGSTGKAAVLEGFSFVGIERERDYLAIARRRVAAARKAVAAC